MKKICLFFLSAGLIFTACKKDSPNSSSGIEGTWNFAGLSANTQSTNTVTSGTDVLKTVSVADYTTTNNAGSINFGSNNVATSNNLGYTASFTAHSYNYTNGVLTDSIAFPYTVSIANSNGTSSYQVIGADSIYFPGGFVSIGGTTTASQPGGGRFSISGNTLTMSMNFSRDSTFSGGDLVQSGKTVITLTK